MKTKLSTLTLLTLCRLFHPSAAAYTLKDDYNTANFFSMFDFFTDTDPTQGYVDYISQSAAQSASLINTANNQIYMGVDSTSVASGRGRKSVRLTSKATYNHGLIVLDLEHMPGSICGVWPAFWTVGPNWPSSGEIDIIEGVNSQMHNAMTLHTGPGCSLAASGGGSGSSGNAQGALFSGSIGTSNCDINAAGQAQNAGCSISTSDQSSYGSGLNSAQGGVYATEWLSTGISIWFFPRSKIPSDLASGSPDPTSWGTPTARFGNSGCNIDNSVKNQQIVFDTTFCGQWAGAVWSTDATCSKKANTCQDYVQNNPSAFKEAFWTVNSLRVYSSDGSAAPLSSSAAPKPSASSIATGTASRSGLGSSVPVPVTSSTKAVSGKPSGIPSSLPASIPPVVPSSGQGKPTSSAVPTSGQGQSRGPGNTAWSRTNGHRSQFTSVPDAANAVATGLVVSDVLSTGTAGANSPYQSPSALPTGMANAPVASNLRSNTAAASPTIPADAAEETVPPTGAVDTTGLPAANATVSPPGPTDASMTTDIPANTALPTSTSASNANTNADPAPTQAAAPPPIDSIPTTTFITSTSYMPITLTTPSAPNPTSGLPPWRNPDWNGNAQTWSRPPWSGGGEHWNGQGPHGEFGWGERGGRQRRGDMDLDMPLRESARETETGEQSLRSERRGEGEGGVDVDLEAVHKHMRKHRDGGGQMGHWSSRRRR